MGRAAAAASDAIPGGTSGAAGALFRCAAGALFRRAASALFRRAAGARWCLAGGARFKCTFKRCAVSSEGRRWAPSGALLQAL